MKGFRFIVSVVGLVGFVAGGPQSVQAAPKDKPPIVHIINVLEGDVREHATNLGPVPIATTMEISTITTVNRSDEPLLVHYRYVVPHPTAEDIPGCLPTGSVDGTADYVVVFDELMRVIVPPFETVHVTFPESLDIPGQFGNTPKAVVEPPTEEGDAWCLNVSLDNPEGGSPTAGVKVDARVSGRIDFPEAL